MRYSVNMVIERMRIEQHLSKKLGQWHVHLIMSEAEFEKQKKNA